MPFLNKQKTREYKNKLKSHREKIAQQQII
jgi:hypothetical protein